MHNPDFSGFVFLTTEWLGVFHRVSESSFFHRGSCFLLIYFLEPSWQKTPYNSVQASLNSVVEITPNKKAATKAA